MSLGLVVTFLCAQSRILTLADALHTAAHAQPQLWQAHAATLAARARAGEARAPLLPQIGGAIGYSRRTGNSVPGFLAVVGGGAPDMGNMNPPPTFDTFNYWNIGLSAAQIIWDGSGKLAAWGASRSLAESQAANERASQLLVGLAVRQQFFAARANRELVEVAKETLANQERHVRQIENYVRIGARPIIDLAQARTDRASGQYLLINAESNYKSAKAQLNKVIGVDETTDYDVADESIAPLAGEECPLPILVAEALRARPEVVSVDKQVRAQQLTVSAARTTFGPTLTAATGVVDAGTSLDALVWNWSFSLTLNWQLFQGFLSYQTLKEANANLDGAMAQAVLTRQQIRLELEQAQLAVQAAKASTVAAQEALVNARERLQLAEGRYQAGLGNVIELGDAQLAYTQTSALRVQADYNVSSARAALLKALGMN